MKQVTIKVEAFATVTVADNWNGDMSNIPMKLDVYSAWEDETSEVADVVETDIIGQTVTHVVDVEKK